MIGLSDIALQGPASTMVQPSAANNLPNITDGGLAIGDRNKFSTYFNVRK